MQNKYGVYRQIRYDRTYRPLGKMTWWRVVLGIALLLFVFLLSGSVSKGFASRGQFKTAQALMISPVWMEKYNPELKAYIEAGVLFENGEYEPAFQAFDALGDADAALTMKSRCALKLAAGKRAAGDFETAFTYLSDADVSLLQGSEAEEYYRLCAELLDHYAGGNVCTAETAEIINTLTGLLNKKDGAQ